MFGYCYAVIVSHRVHERNFRSSHFLRKDYQRRTLDSFKHKIDNRLLAFVFLLLGFEVANLVKRRSLFFSFVAFSAFSVRASASAFSASSWSNAYSSSASALEIASTSMFLRISFSLSESFLPYLSPFLSDISIAHGSAFVKTFSRGEDYSSSSSSLAYRSMPALGVIGFS